MILSMHKEISGDLLLCIRVEAHELDAIGMDKLAIAIDSDCPKETADVVHLLNVVCRRLTTLNELKGVL